MDSATLAEAMDGRASWIKGLAQLWSVKSFLNFGGLPIMRPQAHGMRNACRGHGWPCLMDKGIGSTLICEKLFELRRVTHQEASSAWIAQRLQRPGRPCLMD